MNVDLDLGIPLMVNPNVWPQQPIEMAPMGPVATSETKLDKLPGEDPVKLQRENRVPSFELETFDGSPGNTLRDRRRIEELHSPVSPEPPIPRTNVNQLQESPGAARQTRNAAKVRKIPKL